MKKILAHKLIKFQLTPVSSPQEISDLSRLHAAPLDEAIVSWVLNGPKTLHPG